MFASLPEDDQFRTAAQAQHLGNVMRRLAAERQRGPFLKRLRDIDTGDAHAVKILESPAVMQR